MKQLTSVDRALFKRKTEHRTFTQTLNIKMHSPSLNSRALDETTKRNDPAMSRTQPPINWETENFLQSVKLKIVVHPLPWWGFQNKTTALTW